jgi:glycosyltransferase involved in cell wall biosynthesis
MPEVRSDVLVSSRSSRTVQAQVAGGRELRVREFGRRILAVPVSPETPLEVWRSDADLIHVHMPYPLGELAAVVGARGRPIVCSFHADVVRQARWLRLYRPLVQHILNRADAIIVGSEWIARDSPLFGPSRQVDVIPYGVDTDWFDPSRVSAEARTAIRRRCGVDSRPLIVAVGRLVYYKGFGYLISAARELDAEIVIVGRGPLASELGAQAEQAKNVHLAGAVDEIELRAHLAAADVFVLPSTSRAESFGVATVEAQAMGVPAVVTEVGTGTSEAIEPGTTGVVVRPRDVSALVEGISGLLSDDQRRASMRLAARERTLEHHTLAASAASVQRVYKRVMARSR